ncbi:MAG: MarR family transcriptional regulator [Treponemataceae bacterium]|nr:MarR family transcriptional regulator [Treponemataceae bacterium]
MNSNNLTQFNLPEGFNPLALENQICFSLYVCSKEVIRSYEPLLKPLGLTYTAYITLLALWEKDNVSVKELGEKLFLDSGTLTPLLKKMEQQNLVVKTRSKEDERTVLISLTEEGKALRTTCLEIPQKMMCKKLLEPENAADLIKNLHEIMGNIKNNA